MSMSREDSTRAILDKLPYLSQQALECLNSGILITDASHPSIPIVFANSAFCHMTGYQVDEVVGKNCAFLPNGDEGNENQLPLESIRKALSRLEQIDIVLSNHHKDGSLFWNRLSISPIADQYGKATHFIGILSDVTEQKRYEEQLIFQATHDPLTGLPNRLLLKQRLEDAIRQTSPASPIAALMVLDIDHFNLVNNAVNYDGADLLLTSVTERLEAVFSKNDFLARVGVDEFAFLLTGLQQAREVEAICADIAQTFTEPFEIKGKNLKMSCSIGVSLYPQDGADAETLLKYANMALYRAKEVGRNNTQFFSGELDARTQERIALELALSTAVQNNQLSLHYQPLVDLQTGHIAGLEALARWTHPELGRVSPARFIPVAEECGLIEEIGEWALHQACKDIRKWKDSGLPGMKVAVNVSPRQFRKPGLAGKVEKILKENGVEPRLLCLEITESVLMQDTAASEMTLAALKTMGVELSLDDFGTGFSSLSYLKRFSFDKVKIDKSFVDHVVENANDGAISKAIISMAHSLGIRVVAEGVETEQQCDFLRRNMCDQIQGYLFSAPRPAEEISVFLQEQRRLPDHLLRMHRPARRLLLVDDESNILSTLKRLFRREGYTIFTADSGQAGLALLEKQAVDVIVSDQRMPGMTGVEFLSKAKERWPDTIRIVLSGYTELKSVTDAVNKGAIYRFLTKPWDDAQLRSHVEEAFRTKEMANENVRLNLEVRTANFELAAANRRLEEVFRQQEQRITRDEVALNVVHEALQHVPVPVIGIDEDNAVAFINSVALELFAGRGLMFGCDAGMTIPEVMKAINTSDGTTCKANIDGADYRIVFHRMGTASESRGHLISLTRI